VSGWRKRQIQEKQMPRPQTELTNSRLQVGARVTLAQKNEFQRLGGSTWLKNILNQSIRERAIKEIENERR
jgi:hypothetical protein